MPWNKATRASKPVKETGEDFLKYIDLPPTLKEYNRGQVIYGPGWPNTNLYMVDKGRVKVSRTSPTAQTMIDLFQPGDIFGFSVLNPESSGGDEAVAMESTITAVWSRDQIEECLKKSPELGALMMRFVVSRMEEYAARFAAMHANTVSERLVQALVRLAERYGLSAGKGSVRIPIPLTHKLLAQYIGTSRELVTNDLNRMRRESLIRYSRKGIILMASFQEVASRP